MKLFEMQADMKLTEMQLEIMRVLWESESPLTASEIIARSADRTWKENSIFNMLHSLQRKGAVALDHYKPTVTKSARVYRATLSAEEYAAMRVFDSKPNLVELFRAVVKNKVLDKETKEKLHQVVSEIESAKEEE